MFKTLPTKNASFNANGTSNSIMKMDKPPPVKFYRKYTDAIIKNMYQEVALKKIT